MIIDKTQIFRNQDSKPFYFGAAKVLLMLRNSLGNMTQLLKHSVAHSTKPSSRPKTNNQSIKKSCGQLSKSCQNWVSF